jgi:OOP family OmpA-OmpF porin
MIRNTLFAALVLGLSTSAVMAQDYDDRWGLTPHVGVNFNDSDRDADNGLVLGLGLGRFISPRVHIEVDIATGNADLDGRGDWDNLDFGITGRFFFTELSASRRYYAALGTRGIRHDREGSKTGTGLGAHLGLGVHDQITDNIAFRGEVLYRYDRDQDSLPTEDSYNDVIAQMGLTFSFGEARAVEISPEAEDLGQPMETMPDATPEPMSNDDDNDGVPNDMDRCPGTPAGTMVGRDGCEVAEVIDLRGVNFDFDKCNLRPDAVEILDNAVGVLKSNDLRVSVEGHTDSVGSDAYNETLSECRAKVVYDYLLNNGVEAGKVTGSEGFGESMPIDTNETAEGRARNRRTELKKQ